METFPSKIKKVYYKNGKLKEYAISLGVKSQINDDRFYENKNGKMVCDVLICFPDEYEKSIQDIEELSSLRDELSQNKKTIESLENRLSNIEEEHRKEIKELKDEYSGKIAQLNEDLHEKDLEIERTKTDYEKEIGEFREDIQKQINKLELFDKDKHMNIKDHEDEVSDLKENQFNPEFHMKISDHEKALNKMRGNCLKLRVRDNKEYSSYLEQLDNLGKLDKLFNKDKPIIKEMRKYNVHAIDDKAIDVQFNLIDENTGRADE